jgi:hypothetical protein
MTDTAWTLVRVLIGVSVPLATMLLILVSMEVGKRIGQMVAGR